MADKLGETAEMSKQQITTKNTETNKQHKQWIPN